MEHVECPKDVEKNKLELVSPNGQNSITLVANNDIVGIWISNKRTNEHIAIYNLNGQQHAMGLYGKAHNNAMSVGIGTDKNGDPLFQLTDKEGNVKILTKNDFDKIGS